MARRLVDIRATIPRHPTRKWRTRDSADTIVVHTTASNNQEPSKTARYHIKPGPQNHLSKRGAPCVAYHDMLAKDGLVSHCNDYSDITWHTKGWNGRAVSVALMFKGQTGETPVPVQLLALKEHLVVLCLYLKILPDRIKGHREGPNMTFWSRGAVRYKKTCPGMGIDLDALRDEVTRRLQRRLNAEGLYRGKIDGDFGRKSRAALQAFRPTEDRRPAWAAYR